MRKRRRLADKMTIMVCAVLIAVSAFFYAPMEAYAQVQWTTDWTNWGDGNQVDYVVDGNPFYLSTVTYVDKEVASNGDIHWTYNRAPYPEYYDYEVNWFYPFSAWQDGAFYYCDCFGFNSYVDVYPTFDLAMPSGVQYDLSLNVTQANIVYDGKTYSCMVIPSGDYYRIYFNSVIDCPGGDLKLYGGTMSLQLRGYMSGYIFAINGAQTGLAVATLTPKFVLRVGGQGGPYKIQYRLGKDVDLSVDAIEEQTNDLNQATQNQTNELTNGFDNTKGDTVNSDLSVGLNEFQTAEDSLFSTASSSLSDYQFFNLASVPAMVTGMSFVSSIMTSWFNQAGGASGVGIVLSILFSIMLVAMVLGLYRWYQSKGGKD